MRINPKRKSLALLGVIILTISLLTTPGCATLDVDSYDTGASIASDGIPAVKLDGVPAERYTEPSDQNNVNSSTKSITDKLVVRFIYVGKGDCALISCDGKALLIDGGPSSASSKLYAILKRLGITHLDYIIATHPDADHCGGIAGALNFADCGTFYCSVTKHDTKTFNSILKYLGDTPVTIPSLGNTFSLGAAQVEFVGPVKRTSDTNDGSLVCKITLGNSSFLFTGDAEETSEFLMANSSVDIDADVLKVGHHGSNTSSSDLFLSKVTPKYAIISVGSNNYGHPSNETLQRLGNAGTEVLRTDELGTIIMTTDGNDIKLETTKGIIEK